MQLQIKCFLMVAAICGGVLIGYCRADVNSPVIHWSFDDPEQDKASGELQGALDYVQGASGKALVFDGYTTEVTHSADSTAAEGDALTISAWVAPQEYSLNLSAIVNQQKLERFEDDSIRVRSLYGMTAGPIDSLLPLARSWNNPPQVESVSAGYQFMQYDQYQRAYVFEKQDGAPGPLSFELAASEKTPVVNVAVVIKNWGAAPAMIQVNGKTMQSDQGSAQGLVRTLETDDRVIWIPLKSNSAVKVEIRPVLGTNLNGVLPKPH